MSSFEWMELQTLTSDIAASRSRLAAARSGKDNRLTRVLEQEIATAERRRDELLANITNQVAGADEPAPRVDAGDAPEPVEASLPEPYGDDKNAPEQPPAMVDRVVAKTTASRSTVGSGMSTEGDTVVWDQLTPGDIENAKNEIGTRRAEMMARHTEELQALDADQTQLDTLAQAIELFARKFKLSSEPEPATGVVTLEDERELRLQGRA